MSGNWATRSVWNVPYGTVLRRIDDGETVMVIGGVDTNGRLRTVSLVLPPEAASWWPVRPGDEVAEFAYDTERWEVVA